MGVTLLVNVASALQNASTTRKYAGPEEADKIFQQHWDLIESMLSKIERGVQ